MGLAFSTEGILASGSYDKTIKLWDVEKQECIETLVDHKDTIFDLAFFGDRILVSGSRDNTIRLWDIKRDQ